MILPSQALATAKVRDTAMVLAPHRVETLPASPRDSPIRTVITIGQHDIATLSDALWLSKQSHFPCRFALVTPYSERREGATNQGTDRDNARKRKASTGLLPRLLGIGGLIGLGIGHRDGGTINDFAATPFPEPGRGRLCTQALPTVAGQCRHNAFGEACAGLTVTAGMGRARRWACGDHPRAQATECLAAGAIGRKDLQEKRPQGARRGKEPVSACNPLLSQDLRDVRWFQGAIIEQARRCHGLVAVERKLTGQRGCETLPHKMPPGGMMPCRL